jgi:hypothetical protein
MENQEQDGQEIIETSENDTKTHSKAPWAIVGVLFFLILLTGVGIYIVWAQSKSRLDSQSISVEENQDTNVLPANDSTTEVGAVSGTVAPSPTVQATFTPMPQSTNAPSGTVTPKPSVTPTKGLNLQANPTKTPTPTKQLPISN